MSAWVTNFIEKTSKQFSDLGGCSSRLFHGRGKTVPGLEHVCVDWHPPLVLVSLYDAVEGFELQALNDYLLSLGQNEKIEAVVVHHRYRKENAWQWIFGDEQKAYQATRFNQRFGLEVGRQQNVGFFLDMEPGRDWLSQVSKGKRVLNLFAYTCAFSVVALGCGADKVVNVDMSSRALSRGRENHRLNDQDTSKVVFLAENILKSWGRIRKQGPYDVIIIDPPSFQKGSFVAERDYVKVIRRIPELAASGCDVLVCLNAPEIGEQVLPQIIECTLPDLRFEGRLANHPNFPEKDPNHSLKLFHYRVL
jgi:23S rRNA (cytosine1962-C5)-methyltransferase